MQYMIVEHFRDGDPVPVYRRFRDKGRMAPEGLRYVSSWVTQDLGRCYQVMVKGEKEVSMNAVKGATDLLPTIKTLPRAEKLRLIQLLAEDLAREESVSLQS